MTTADAVEEQDISTKLRRSEARREALRRRDRVLVWLSRAGLLVVLLGGWEWAVASGRADAFFFAQPSTIWAFLVEEFTDGGIWIHIGVTLRETMLGFAIGAAAGVIAGIVRTQSTYVAGVTDPYMTILNVLPRVALAPMFIIWFGIGEMSKVALAVSLVFFILMLSTEAGMKSLDREMIVTMRALGATSRQLFWKVMLPGAVPAIFSGLRLGVVYSLLAVVVGEMIAARAGLGQRIAFHSASFRTEGVLGTILILALIGLALNFVVARTEARLLRWRGDGD